MHYANARGRRWPPVPSLPRSRSHVMTAVIERADLTALTDDQLAAAYFDEGADLDAIDAEHKRREHARQQRRQARRQRQGGWYEAAYQQFLNAEAATAGVLLNAKGISRNIEPFSLWSGSQWCVDAYASWELLRFWETHPRLTVTEYERQQRRERREERDYAMDRDEATGLRPDADEASRVQRDSISHVVPGPGRASEAQPQERPVPAHAGRDAAVRAGGDMLGGIAGRVAETAVREGIHAGERAARAAVRSPAYERVAARRAAIAGAAVTEVAKRAAAIRAGEDVSKVERMDIAELDAEMSDAPAVPPSAVIAVSDESQRAAMVIYESLRYARRVLTRHVEWPGDAELDTVLLWLIHANARDRDEQGKPGTLIWRASPRLLLTSGARGSGKSTALDLMAYLCGSRFGRLPKITGPGFAKLMGKYREPAFIDEARMVFGTGTRNQELQGNILAGYTRNATALTGHASASHVPDSLFGAVAYAGKDNLITEAGDAVQDLLDRSVIIRMARAGRHYPDIDDLAEHAAALACQGMGTWTATKRAELIAAVRELGRLDVEAGEMDLSERESGAARAAQIWRPLLAIADVIGASAASAGDEEIAASLAEWPQRARAACAQLSMSAGATETQGWLDDLEAVDGIWNDEDD